MAAERYRVENASRTGRWLIRRQGDVYGWMAQCIAEADANLVFHLSRWDAFKAIFRPLVKRYEVRVSGTDAAYRVVFGGDYTPPEPGPSVTMASGGKAETKEETT